MPAPPSSGPRLHRSLCYLECLTRHQPLQVCRSMHPNLNSSRGVPSEALLAHAYRAPPEVTHSQSYAPIVGRHSESCAPTEGPCEFSNSDVPPEAPPAQFWSPARGASESPSSSSSKAPPTLYTAPSEAPLRYLVPEVSPSTVSSSTVPCSRASIPSASLGAAPFPVPELAPNASSSTVPCTNDPSSGPRA
jgi:hypothetical protein